MSEEEDIDLEVEVILIIVLLIVYIFVAQLIEEQKIDFLHESGIAILLGAISGIIFLFVGSSPISFSGEGFFYFVLPPIIFGAGYTLKEKNFFKNIGYITLFGLLGTLISMVVMSAFVIIFNDYLFPLGHSQRLTTAECLLLSAVLCATDSVAALAIVKETEFPTLNSILFGEGVVNDAVAILIFKSVEKMIEEGKENVDEDIIDTRGVEVGIKEILATTKDFFILTLSSLGLGIAIGLISAFILKNIKSLRHHPTLEIFLIMLFGYMSYLLAELLNLSGIMTLFLCGVIMSHYTYHNVSKSSKVGSVVSITSIAFLAEAFLFTYLGLSIFSTESSSFSLNFTFLIIIAAVLARFASVFLSIAIYALFRRCVIEIDCKQLTLIWFSGLIRGAIAFALSLEIGPSIAPHRDQMVSTTLMMVLMTTVVLGGVMSAFAKLIGLDAEVTDEDELAGTHDSKIERLTDVVFKDKKKGLCKRMFRKLDNKILKPLFGGDMSKIKRASSFQSYMTTTTPKPAADTQALLRSSPSNDADMQNRTASLMRGANLDRISEHTDEN
ncbi:unnamed protein product [Moneuplotes crassus]|uniref:Sodium/hydrogen exchanger n=2 Tax=Euplotes crassus TaxID=5936 RepID=A0AAD1U8T4_EUPCR|nr:unnamed protein product [Moneuplotes crassus]